MAEDELNIEKIIQYWKTEAEDDLQVAEHLIEKQDYSYALFFGHLAVEKILKALYVGHKKAHAPPIHNLLRLAKLIALDLDSRQKDTLIVISSFNIEARYPDIKRAFRSKCTKEYTSEQMSRIKEIFQCLKKMMK